MRSRVLGGTVAVLLTLVGVAACGDDETDRPGTDVPSADDSQTGASTSAPATPTDTDATVEPASGEVTGLEGVLSFHLTAEHEWRFDESGGATFAKADLDSGSLTILADDNSTQSATLDEDFRTVFEILRTTGTYTYQRAENRTVAAVEGWVIRGQRDGGYRFYQWGTLRDGRTVTIDFEYHQDLADAMTLIDAVLASVEWT